MKPAHIIGMVVLVVCLVFTLMTFSQGLAPYVTVADAQKRPNQTVQVQGKILKETVRFDTQHGELRFDILDKHNNRLSVAYAQPKPENFDTATNVDAVGKIVDGVFRADTLLIKCPSRYGAQKPGAMEAPAAK